MTEIPNLDCMDEDDLQSFLADEPPENVPEDVARILRQYASCRLTAVRCRLAGYINSALKLEDRCDSLYRQLGRRYRW